MIVLAYHKINNVEQFEKQIVYLKRHYKITGEIDLKERQKKQLIITVDDGDPSFYKNAFPILKKYNLPAILFVITNLINTKKPFWWDEIEYYLGKEEGNKKVWEVKKWPNTKRETFLEKLRKTSDKTPFYYEQLSSSQLREMQDVGIIIANHSHTHPMFDQCTTQELEEEMQHSTKILKSLGFTPEVFAYPNGNFSSAAEAQLNKYGILNAFLFDHKINTSSHALKVSRLIVNDTTPMWKFKFILSGWHTKILPLTKALGKLR